MPEGTDARNLQRVTLLMAPEGGDEGGEDPPPRLVDYWIRRQLEDGTWEYVWEP